MAEDVYSNIQVINQSSDPNSDYSYFVDEVIRSLADDLVKEKGYTENQAYNLIYRGGLSIYTTQDIEMQKIVDNTFTNEASFPKKNEDFSLKLMYTLSV